MDAATLKILNTALAHLKKVDGKLNLNVEDEYTDQYIYNAHIKTQASIVSLERAIQRINKGC